MIGQYQRQLRAEVLKILRPVKETAVSPTDLVTWSREGAAVPREVLYAEPAFADTWEDIMDRRLNAARLNPEASDEDAMVAFGREADNAEREALLSLARQRVFIP